MQTITAFARQFGLSRSTLLYYDRIGLLKPAALSPAGYRLYGEEEQARMARIDTFRRAGLPLTAIRELLDSTVEGNVQQALEERLAALNEEIGQMRKQQDLLLRLLGREQGAPIPHNMDLARWVAMLEEAGMDEGGRRRWHTAFEREAPEAHGEFLRSLGLSEEEIAEIRRRFA